MRIIIEPTVQEEQHRVVIQHQRDDLVIEEVARLLRAALVAYGFPLDTVNEILPDVLE